MGIQFRAKPFVVVALAGSAASLAHADFVGSLGTITPSGTFAFANSNVTTEAVPVVPYVAPFNFLDHWSFTLGANASVSGVAATINFTNGPDGSPLFGIENLQLKLVADQIGGPVLVSWLTVTTPAPGLNQLVALVPTAPLGAGNYDLQVRGTLTAPGSYSGSLIAAPPAVVPLPAALPLLLSGLGVLGAVGAGRRRQAVS